MSCTLRAADRNLLALQSFMLGAHVLGNEGLLCVTGDPSTEHGGRANVFDARFVGLIKMAAQLNAGRNLLGERSCAVNRFFHRRGSEPEPGGFFAAGAPP